MDDGELVQEDRVTHLIPATLDDAALLLSLRNDPGARANFFNQGSVTPEEHIRWLLEVLADPKRHLFMIQNEEGEPIGQVRFDVADEVAEISITIAADRRGQGYGAASMRQSSEGFLEHNQQIKRIIAKIKRDNDISIKAFLRAGFKEYQNEGGVVYLAFEKEGA